MIRIPSITRAAVLLAAAAFGLPASAITAGDLSARLKAGEVIHLIDLRPANRFDAGSIPGAMSVPEAIILEKKLPPLSPVVLFDDGLGRVDVAGIAAELNKRPGWKAEVLEGGLAAWRALPEAADNSPTGLRAEDVQHITYDDLAALRESVVLVDVRAEDPATRGRPAVRATLGRKPARTDKADPVCGFCEKSGGRTYRHSLAEFRAHHAPPVRARANKGSSRPAAGNPGSAATPPLVVLVGAADDDQRETVRRLRAEGYGRVLVLAGGDESILLEGRRGKGRLSGPVIEGKRPESAREPQQPAKP